MKICFVNSFYPPYVGGAERYVSSLATKLAELGNEVTVYCASRPLHHGEFYDNNVKVVRMMTPAMFYGTPLAILPRSFFADEFDVIHSNFPSPYLAASSSYVSRLRRIPSVLTWHNDLPAVSPAAGSLVRFHDGFALSYLGNFRRIIATTASYARSSRLLRLFSSRVTVVPNGVDTKKFNPQVNGDGIRERYGLQGKKVALFVGAMTRWHGYKGLDILIMAFKILQRECKDVSLLVVGEGEMKMHYERLASQLGVNEAITFAGSVDERDLPRYYAAADLCILPSKNRAEGYGLVLLEAMASGKAVIGTKVGGIPDVVVDGVNGVLVKPNDAPDLADALKSLCSHAEKLGQMGYEGRKYAEHLDWSLIAKKIETIYAEVAGKSA